MSNVDIEAVIYKAWRKKGLVDVQNLEGGAIRYVAYYTVDPTVRSVDNDQQKQFALMSKRPRLVTNTILIKLIKDIILVRLILIDLVIKPLW